LCKPKEEEGLGTKDIHWFNGLLAKWKLFSEEKERGKKVLQAIYGLVSGQRGVQAKYHFGGWKDLVSANPFYGCYSNLLMEFGLTWVFLYDETQRLFLFGSVYSLDF